MFEEEGCEDKINSMTNASGCLLIHRDIKGHTYQNSSNQSISIIRTNFSDNEDNLTTIINLLENGTWMIADNYLQNGYITFTYNLDEICCLPSDDWFFIKDNRAPSEAGNAYKDLGKVKTKAYAWYLINRFNYKHNKGWSYCLGYILYDYTNTHFMSYTVRNWHWFGIDPDNPKSVFINEWMNSPALPIFSINNSVGSWLVNNIEDTTVTGYMVQNFKKQTSDAPGVVSYNVVGYRNITSSPSDKITVISNRIDGFWAQTPGDSGIGGAIVLGVAKYMNDYNIKPKYNLTFLFTTGEEYGMRGAQHYYDTHTDKNFNCWIGTDQLGFKQDNTTLLLIYKNTTTSDIMMAITNETEYTDRTGYAINVSNTTGAGGTEYKVWNKKTGCDAICFSKGGNWDMYHRAGENYNEGDALKNMDRNDTNVTFELFWNITKYFTVNPNCWFSNVTYEAFDSPNDGDTLPDSIRANFTFNTIMPHDKVMVALYYFGTGEKGPEYQYYSSTNYTIGSGGVNKSIIFTIPDDVAQGDYTIRLKLYNSTGRINYIVGIEGNQVNDTNESGYYHLYHPFGYTKIGASSQSVEDRITGSVFTANEYGTADNITAFINQAFGPPGPYKCMIYRSNDSKLISTTTEDWYPLPGEGNQTPSAGWAVFNFTGAKPVFIKDCEYVLTCWGANEYSTLQYDDIDQSRGRYDNEVYGNPPPYADFTNENKLYSIYCSYTPDTTPPEITNISDSPDPVGFGFNVTINADVLDYVSGLDTVNVSIGYPGLLGRKGNFTMNHISGNQYQYVFSGTWLVGQYNYTIWATDNSSNINSSTNHSFNVSAQATISVATLKDSYVDDEYINITDPPTPPEDYYLVGRGLTWDKYYNHTTGKNILEISTGPLNYQNETDEWIPINNTLTLLGEDHPAYNYGYRAGNDRGLYNVYFKPNTQDDWPVAFAYNKSTDPVNHVVRSKLLGVGYLDPTQDGAYEYLQPVQSSQGEINNNSAIYENVFTGTDVIWSYGNTGLKEELILGNETKVVLQNHPPSEFGLSNQESYLVFITQLDYQNLDLYNETGLLTGNFTLSKSGVDFRDALGNFKCALPLGEAYEQYNITNSHRLIYRVLQYQGNYYLLSGLKLSKLHEMVFPVVIDPTLSVGSTISDGYIQKSNSNYNVAWTSSTGTVYSSSDYIYIGQQRASMTPGQYTYYIRRGFVFFNTSALPSNAYVDNASLSFYKYSDLSVTDFDITIQNGQPTYPHDPLQTGDYDKDHYSGNYGSLNTVNFVNFKNYIYLTNYSCLTKEGMTKLCVQSSRDISGTAPTGNEFVIVYSKDKTGPKDYSPRLTVEYRNQSKIKNIGSTNISGYLLIQVQYNDSGNWTVDNDTVNETTLRTINSSDTLALDTIFNGLVNTNDLTNGNGTYRVYAAFRDDDGNILQCNDDTYLVATWEFTVTFS